MSLWYLAARPRIPAVLFFPGQPWCDQLSTTLSSHHDVLPKLLGPKIHELKLSEATSQKPLSLFLLKLLGWYFGHHGAQQVLFHPVMVRWMDRGRRPYWSVFISFGNCVEGRSEDFLDPRGVKRSWHPHSLCILVQTRAWWRMEDRAYCLRWFQRIPELPSDRFQNLWIYYYNKYMW